VLGLDSSAVRRYSVAIALAAFLATPAAAQVTTATIPAKHVDLSSVHIDNFGQVNANYYRGAQPEGQDYATLSALGIRTVIDLTKDGDSSEAASVEQAGMRFFRIPMTTHESPTADQISRFLAIVNDPANQPVYVHCQGGRHRTGVMTAVYRMTADGWDADRSFGEMKRYKFGADFLHPEFKDFVYSYHADAAPAVAAAAAAPAAAKQDR
jgi:tyrosine-protein phosphatase SIW14